MIQEKRKYPRFNPRGLVANISLILPSNNKEVNLSGTIIDMSYSGFKIKLDSALPVDAAESKLRVQLTLPDSNLPITISGVIKHFNHHSECGLHYANHHDESDVDDLMFECIKSSLMTD